ncbi:phosphoglycerate kinase [Candidatus Marsarchaeota G1 archaeon OSP_C]|uniref:Phosphoglycerate kinase n=1 Tax=Candidatus Marsarchaeota G1 archaeon OSP_C TaxID=1978154 RepID=A0A2R6ASI6_9ARCH|nr:MAG: phosphoglycerate kinase [Candidatus Marsarchaeota G1 archaeon OSP_C]
MELLKLLCELGIYTVIGGGHTRIIAEQLGLVDKLGYASTGGGALLTLLSGEPLPALQALSFAFERTKVACGDVNGRD